MHFYFENVRKRQEAREASDRENLLAGYPIRLAKKLRNEWFNKRHGDPLKTEVKDGDRLFEANQLLVKTRDVAGQLPKDIDLNTPDHQLREIASVMAGKMHEFIIKGCTLEELKLHLQNLYSVSIPARHLAMVADGQKRIAEGKAPLMTVEGLKQRLKDPAYWRRVLRHDIGRILEYVQINAGTVHRRADAYVSNETLHRFRAQRRRNALAMENTTLENEQGLKLTQAELSARNVSNPAIQRAELMTRIKGYELIGMDLGHAALFFTVTAPSKYHPYKQVGKWKVARNRKWEQAGRPTPRDTQQYMNEAWQRTRAMLKKEGIEIYGFAMREPHHDATPHWHLLIWCHPDHADRLTAIYREQAIREDRHELKDDISPRFKVEPIDPAKGGATAYVSKYISKNIDGAFEFTDQESGLDSATAAERVRAWASCWGIRQFQAVGGPPVGIWRELRRLDPAGLLDSLICEAAKAADAGDWAEFVRLNGGPARARKLRPLKTWREEQTQIGSRAEVDQETGEYISVPTQENRLTKYGDIAPPLVVGVSWFEQEETEYGPVMIYTGWGERSRTHEWRIVSRSGTSKKAEAKGPAMARRAEKKGQGEAAAPRSSVNNCNHPPFWVSENEGGQGIGPVFEGVITLEEWRRAIEWGQESGESWPVPEYPEQFKGRNTTLEQWKLLTELGYITGREGVEKIDRLTQQECHRIADQFLARAMTPPSWVMT